MPCVGKNQPRPPRFRIGEKLAFVSHSNFSPRSTVTVEFIPARETTTRKKNYSFYLQVKLQMGVDCVGEDDDE
jgi:hypothetical protein